MQNQRYRSYDKVCNVYMKFCVAKCKNLWEIFSHKFLRIMHKFFTVS